ncbi:GNAT family N-acetyltransferase [Luteimonas panaciterrae]|uniref:GNAT family N-acetyltransferase n=1 Tax=Luteimonas panaciterrae TaxID=363885 RepID=UPI001CFC04FE|nr:GNAT family N-acetyltransferase [Luteimonas panaciterrae]
MKTSIRRATLDDLDALTPLFDAYRGFYEQRSEPELARDFLQARLQRGESVIFLGHIDNTPAGFTQLYPMFSSVRATRIWILNDLFVAPEARRHGVAQGLLQAAADFARADGAARLELETTPDNLTAQALYRAQGWQAFDDTLRFRLPLVD